MGSEANIEGAAQGRVAVVGLGKIGLPLALQYISHGHEVTGCDINPHVVDLINAGNSHVDEEAGLAERVAQAVTGGRLRATTDTSAAVSESAVVVVIVPVMVTDSHVVDYKAIDAATAAVGKGLRPGTLVVFETTLPVGTTSGRLRAILEETSGLVAGRDFLLAYSPERVSSGRIFADLKNYPKVIGGIDERSAKAAHDFYASVLDAEIRMMSSADEAEFVKLIETTYRDVNIALANEFARFADGRGLDVSSAIAAANTQPYSHIHAPGLGVGGHCIPVYPYFLIQGAETGLMLPRAARAINDSMAEYAARRLEEELGSLEGRRVLLLGVAYRGDVRETAFTSAKRVREALQAHGADVYADDPLFSSSELRALGYEPVSKEMHSSVQAIVLQADHSAYRDLDFADFPACHVVLDGRRAIQRQRVESAGIRYIFIGDGVHAPVPVRG